MEMFAVDIFQKHLENSVVLVSWVVMYILGLYQTSGLFYIQYPAGYSVSFDRYPAGWLTRYRVELFNK